MHIKTAVMKYYLLVLIVLTQSCSAGGAGDSVLSKTFKGTRLLPDAVNRIYIEKISGGNIDASVIDSFDYSLRKKVSLNKKLSMVDSAEKSDVILTVKLARFSSKILKFNSSGIAEEKKLKLDSYVWLAATSNGELRIRKKLVESELFYSDTKPPVVSEYKAIAGLTDILAERVVSVVSTGWYVENPE